MRHYFAYASNMDRAHMARLCPRAEVLGPALIRHHAFLVVAGGYGSITPRRGAMVHGILWRISARDLVALDAYESVETGLYRQVMMPVHHDGKFLRALVYVANDETPARPSVKYREMVLKAARDWNFPSNYIAGLERAMMAS